MAIAVVVAVGSRRVDWKVISLVAVRVLLNSADLRTFERNEMAVRDLKGFLKGAGSVLHGFRRIVISGRFTRFEAVSKLSDEIVHKPVEPPFFRFDSACDRVSIHTHLDEFSRACVSLQDTKHEPRFAARDGPKGKLGVA